MNDERTFLAFIHKTAAMGVGTLPQAMGLPQSRAMVPALQDQLRECRTIAARAQAYARAQGEALRGPGSAALALAGAALRTRAVLDPPPPHWRSGSSGRAPGARWRQPGGSTSAPGTRTRRWWSWAAACWRPRSGPSRR